MWADAAPSPLEVFRFLLAALNEDLHHRMPALKSVPLVEIFVTMGLARRAAADAFVTFMWTFTAASLPSVATLLGLYLDDDAQRYIMAALMSLHIICSGMLCEVAEGASFNPTASLAAALTTTTSFASLAVSVPAQMAGAVAGVRAIRAVTPAQAKGPALTVPLLTGAVAECVLTFAITLVVLWASRRNSAAGTGVVIAATLALVAAGASVTGPSMNPAHAFAWAYIEGWHSTWEHFWVYWVAPMVGTVVAVWLFNWLFKAPKEKVKAS